ncbi:MAG: 50S ribosomal protein L3 [Acidobacteria bacterium]|nr:50S ribosomal protein L3 [Acidobacteriota bacterium]MCH8990233.1 50S ribosomal protein L3 [Acidobacteriota bacterium]
MIIGEKLGMTQVFDDENRAIPVTVIKAGPVRVTQIKRPETDGYAAVQIAYKEMAAANRAQSGHFAKAGVAPHRHVVEVRVDDVDEYELGQEITIGEVLEAGQRADAAGISKGKGFAGVMKRHGFKGASSSHGVHKVHRSPGSIGACATPARVFKGKRMPGRMGGDQTTILNLEVIQVDADRNVLLLKGAVPGPKGAIVLIREAVKQRA